MYFQIVLAGVSFETIVDDVVGLTEKLTKVLNTAIVDGEARKSRSF